MRWKVASAKKDKYKHMIDVFNQHIYLQSRHFHTQITKKWRKNLKYIFLSHVKTIHDLSSRSWWDRFSFRFSLNPGRDNLIAQKIFQSWAKINCWIWEKPIGETFSQSTGLIDVLALPVTAESCSSPVNAETRPIKPSWNDWTKGFVGLLTFNKRLFFTCCQSCVWRWGRTVNSMLKKTLWNKSDCPHTRNVKATVSNLSFRRNKSRPL